MKLQLSARMYRACFPVLALCTLMHSGVALSKESTATPVAPLKAAMDALVAVPELTPSDKQLIESLPDIIASVIAKQEGVASDIIPEIEYNFGQVAASLQSLDQKLLKIAHSADPMLAHHISVVRKTMNLVIDVITLTQEPNTADGTQVTRQTEALVDVVREKVNALMRQLLKMQSQIDSISSSTTDIFGSLFPILESNFDFIESELEVIESKTDACCKVTQSKIDACCKITQSKLDVIISDLDHLATSAFPSFDSNLDFIESELEVIESKTDACCKVTQSKLDVVISLIDNFSSSGFPTIDSNLDLIESELEVIESKTDACCKATQSKLDILLSKDDTILSLVSEIASDVDVIISKIDNLGSTTNTIDSTVDVIESIVEDIACALPKPLPAPVGGIITVTQPGSYALCSSTCGTQIIVDSSDVCIDLGCQTLSFTSSNGSVITINDGWQNVTIHNGTIVGTCLRSPSSNSYKRYDENSQLKNILRGAVTSCGNDGITIGADCSGILLKDLSISTVNCQGVHANVGCSDIVIRNCDISDTGETGILFEGDCAKATIADTTIHDCSINGIHFFTSTDLLVQNTFIQNADPANTSNGAGILLQGITGTPTQNCTLENVNIMQCGTGLKLDTATNISVSGSTIIDSVLYGIFAIQSTSNVNIDAVFIDEVNANTSGDGIFVENGASTWTISNTVIQDCLGNGINLNGNGGAITDFTINNCTVSGCSDNGMFILNCSNLCVQNSTFTGNGLNTSSAKGGIDISNGTSCNFIQCRITGNTGSPSFGFSLEDCTRCTILQCLITNNTSAAASNGILIMGASTNNDIRNNSVTYNTSGINSSVGINYQSASNTNKFFGNYVCGHDTDYIGVGFIGDLTNASPYQNVTCSNTGTDQIQDIDSKLDVLSSKITALDEEINSKLDIILNGTC